MNAKELIKREIEKLGLNVEHESDDNVLFRYQISWVQAGNACNADVSAATMLLQGQITARDEKEMRICTQACNELNKSLLHVKLYLDSDLEVMIASEFFYKDENDFGEIMEKCLDMLIVAKRRFLLKYKELQEEDNLLSELENS